MELSNQLIEAAHTASLLDRKMEKLNNEINILKEQQPDDEPFFNTNAQTTKLLNALQTIEINPNEEN